MQKLLEFSLKDSDITGIGYKVFKVKNGKLYPPKVNNPGNKPTEIGVWLPAEEGEFAGLSKSGRPQVKSSDSGTLAYRPGWHLGELPRAKQFDRTNKETGEKEFPKNFVWAEVEYIATIDYQDEADEMGYMRTKPDGTWYRGNKYQHSLAGLKKLPKNGYYKYRTNPNPETEPWIISGAMKVTKLLDDFEVNQILVQNGEEPIHRQGGDRTLEEIMGNKKIQKERFEIISEIIDYSKKGPKTEKPSSEFRYVTNHGTGPGMKPKDVYLLDSVPLNNAATIIYTDRALTDDELKRYDIKSKKDSDKYIKLNQRYIPDGIDIV